MARRRIDRDPRPGASTEPSHEWGWHGGFPRGFGLAGLASLGLLICYLLTSRDFELGAMAVPWIAGIAVVIALGLLLSARRRR